ncbi:laccase domain-containing protein, partial [Salmonella enterica subsp. enterica serovar Cerro]|nr:laccase domain-containing protein [Salmonella enterica subsp. enterica serovar Cerro]
QVNIEVTFPNTIHRITIFRCTASTPFFLKCRRTQIAHICQIHQRLANTGVEHVYGGDRCTFSESETFFSYRRDKTTGRMASFIW